MNWRERQTLDRFRRRQILRASQVDSLIRREWATLDISDIDRGRERVLDGIEARVIGLRTLEAREADVFVSKMRELQRVGSGSIVLAPANPGTGLRESLEISGPVSFKQRVGAGALDEVAFLAARDQMMAEARKLIMDAGRRLCACLLRLTAALSVGGECLTVIRVLFARCSSVADPLTNLRAPL